LALPKNIIPDNKKTIADQAIDLMILFNLEEI
jgi:hypothetical protein